MKSTSWFRELALAGWRGAPSLKEMKGEEDTGRITCLGKAESDRCSVLKSFTIAIQNTFLVYLPRIKLSYKHLEDIRNTLNCIFKTILNIKGKQNISVMDFEINSLGLLQNDSLSMVIFNWSIVVYICWHILGRGVFFESKFSKSWSYFSLTELKLK